MILPKYNYHEEVLPARAALAERFPLAFMAKGAPTKIPLKIGIDKDILARVTDIPRALLRYAIGDYTTGPKYARAMVAGTQRVDLDGNHVGEVTAEQEAHSKAREETRRRKSQAHHRRQRQQAAVEAHP
jgi:ProP effector